MKTMFFLLAAFFMVQATQAQKTVYDANVQQRSVAAFHAIHISNAFEVFISQGETATVAVSASQAEDLGRIETTVENGVLKIRLDDSKKWWGNNRKLRAYIAVKNLDELRASGACEIKIEGTLRTGALKLDLSGATDLAGELEVGGELNLTLSGASDVTLNGSSESLVVDASGASDVKAYNFTTNTCTVDASGASGVRITVDKELSAKLSGASSVSYKGAAMIRDIKTSGASSISRKS